MGVIIFYAEFQNVNFVIPISHDENSQTNANHKAPCKVNQDYTKKRANPEKSI